MFSASAILAWLVPAATMAAGSLVTHIYHVRQRKLAAKNGQPADSVPVADPAPAPSTHPLLSIIEEALKKRERALLHSAVARVAPGLEPFLDPTLDRVDDVVRPLADAELEKIANLLAPKIAPVLAPILQPNPVPAGVASKMP